MILNYWQKFRHFSYSLQQFILKRLWRSGWRVFTYRLSRSAEMDFCIPS